MQESKGRRSEIFQERAKEELLESKRENEREKESARATEQKILIKK